MAIDFEELLAKKRPTTVDVALALDADVAEAHATALAAYEVAKAVSVDNPDQKSAAAALRDAEAALEDAEAAAAESVVTFRFQGLGRSNWDALVDEHPATREQKDKARKDNASVPVWNEDTFAPALVAACCIDPVMSYEQAQQLWKSGEWNWAELRDLFNAAYNASRGRRVPQLGKGSGRTQN
jgi:hypothetical protein